MGFQRVIQILDDSVGGPDAGVLRHGPFWRNISRDQFIVKKVFGRPLVVLGDGAASNLVLALKGESPFGSDLDDAPEDADTRRMPAGRPAVPADQIAFIEKWIDDECPEESTEAGPTWRTTNAPIASSRTDDIWFIDPDHGWAVNSNGQILHTEDGFTTWQEQLLDDEAYFRCIGFASATRGWAGTLTPPSRRLFETSDGGTTWTVVTGLPASAPVKVCGLSVVSDSVVYASGSNEPGEPARMMRTVDGGVSWQGFDMEDHATLLVDTHFVDDDNGWVVGGRAAQPADPNPATEAAKRAHVQAVVLRTSDGGQTWTDMAEPIRDHLPLGEWGWKIHFIDDRIGFVALESFERGAILKTVDGGDNWTRIDINDPQGNANLEGVGFVSETVGWVGGWGPGPNHFSRGSSSATADGGATWQDANDIGLFINRFRFFGDPVSVGYASGQTIYKYSAEPLPPPSVAAVAADGVRLLADNKPRISGVPLQIPVEVPADAGRLKVAIWNRFGRAVRRLVDETDPVAGIRTIEWNGVDDAGQPVGDGEFLIRVTVDGHAESQIVHLGA
ncbi:YCF48-related protein [Nocardia sp. XZ_19_231]|uniref:YCF48-related protein n=1 Tax=Nocardia sp. XZ_19_231 TaxID=2769252 RepID=UPI00188F13DB|nr:YCF48-related protein [Nocardia sp. XZ_19_231]